MSVVLFALFAAWVVVAVFTEEKLRQQANQFSDAIQRLAKRTKAIEQSAYRAARTARESAETIEALLDDGTGAHRRHRDYKHVLAVIEKSLIEQTLAIAREPSESSNLGLLRALILEYEKQPVESRKSEIKGIDDWIMGQSLKRPLCLRRPIQEVQLGARHGSLDLYGSREKVGHGYKPDAWELAGDVPVC